MNVEGRRRPVLLAAAGAGILGVVGLVLVGRSLMVTSPSATGSLLELLEDSPRRGKAPASDPPRRQAPQPPAQLAWVSPLRQACPMRDTTLQLRLERKLAELAGSRRRIPIDPSNYGRRFHRDLFGNPVDPTPRVVVLHETVYGLSSALNTFQTPHPNDDDQVSYHTLIGQDGAVLDIVDPANRAFGAGFSAFGGQWVVTNRKVSGSINNFALHLSLESPLDGENEGPAHSGYSDAQYDSLAVVLADWMERYPIAPEAITTHRHVDLGQERSDPRSFNWPKLRQRLAALGMIC
jgi:N-acetyl-anhydromuramyl-L-alanine amidase AmpD